MTDIAHHPLPLHHKALIAFPSLSCEERAGFIEPTRWSCYQNKTSPEARQRISGSNRNEPVLEARMAVISPITIARFWSKVAVAGDNECWLWKGAKNGNGYGNFRMSEYGRATFSAHRVAYLLMHDDWPPEGMLVRHKCDTPLCVNPHHLEYGTVADNMRDMYERGRNAVRDQRGEKNGAAKLSASDVEEIRVLISTGHTNTAIAVRFGVTHSLISRIRRGRSWAA